jgi:hypothetical protein
MRRINLTDGSSWFDESKAEAFEEAAYFDGHNFISVATKEQWAHETLYRTKTGMYVLHRWYNLEHIPPTYELVDDETAHEWLLANDHADALPKEIDEEMALDEKGGTPIRSVRIKDSLWAKAQSTGNASKLINSLLKEYFQEQEEQITQQ